MRLLLDTNVLVDYYARREPFFDAAAKLRCAAYFGDVELWASAQSFADIEYILRRAIPIDALRAMMRESLGFLNISTPSATDVHDAIASAWPDFEDFLVARSAERVRADYLVTRDANGFAQARIPVVSPTEFLSIMEKRHGIVYDDIEW